MKAFEIAEAQGGHARLLRRPAEPGTPASTQRVAENVIINTPARPGTPSVILASTTVFAQTTAHPPNDQFEYEFPLVLADVPDDAPLLDIDATAALALPGLLRQIAEGLDRQLEADRQGDTPFAEALRKLEDGQES